MEVVKLLVGVFVVAFAMLLAVASVQTLSRGGTLHGTVLGLIAILLAVLLFFPFAG